MTRDLHLNRRHLILGSAALFAMPQPLRAAAGGMRKFRVMRNGDDIGSHVLDVRTKGDELHVSIDIELKVKILGITAYRYEMANREVWRGGRLISMNSVSDDDGDAAFARAASAGEQIEVEGSYWSGVVPGDSATTTYWSKAFLTRPVWISTADGDPLKVTSRAVGPGDVAGIATEKWTVSGDLDVDLHYRGDEWVSVRFDAGGEDALYVPEALSPSLAAVWDAAR